MVEVQRHGFSFEKWVRDSLFGEYEGNYMQKWDIPPDRNQHELIPSDFWNIPVSVKTAKYGSEIHDSPLLFGLPFANPVISSSRSFNQDCIPARRGFAPIFFS